MRRKQEARLNAWLAEEAQKSIQPKPLESIACAICLIEFEPKTPKKVSPAGPVHYGCYEKHYQ